jgi:hypothetical protein
MQIILQVPQQRCDNLIVAQNEMKLYQTNLRQFYCHETNGNNIQLWMRELATQQ